MGRDEGISSHSNCDRVAQLVEQLAFNQLVRGSSPRAVTISLYLFGTFYPLFCM